MFDSHHLRCLAGLIALALAGCASTGRVASDDNRRTPDNGGIGAASSQRGARGASSTANDRQLTTLGTYRVTRFISMYYRLDLMKDNRHAMAMAKTMRLNEERIRGCYSSRLNSAPKLKGELDLTFQLSKASGTMQRINRVAGSLTDRELVSCIVRELAQLPFNPPIDMQGKLHYSFDAVERLARN